MPKCAKRLSINLFVPDVLVFHTLTQIFPYTFYTRFLYRCTAAYTVYSRYDLFLLLTCFRVPPVLPLPLRERVRRFPVWQAIPLALRFIPNDTAHTDPA